MDQSQLEALVLAHAEPLKQFLGLDDWKIYYEFKRIATGEWAVCDTSDLDYKMATITVDMDGATADQQVIDSMFHELAHVLHADFTNYRLTSEALCSPITDQVQRVERRAWKHAAEGFVLRMEWVWRNHLRDAYLDSFTR